MTDHLLTAGWSEADSETFQSLASYAVPERERQIETICALLPADGAARVVLDLCCGEGLLSAAILDRFPDVEVHGLDGSAAMLARARELTRVWGDRFVPRRFDLAADDWRRPAAAVRAVVSSLAVHHLDGVQKQALYRHLHQLLAPGGALVIADLIAPAGPPAVALAAAAWDRAVRERARRRDGHEAGFETFRAERWNLYRYPDPVDKPSPIGDHLRWLAAAGFVDVDVYWLLAGHAIYGGRKAPAEPADA